MIFPESTFFCDGELALFGLFDLSYLPQLLGYSFIPSTIIALVASSFIFFKDKGSVRSLLLLLTAVSFSLWSLNDTFQWITVPAHLNLFSWQLSALFEISVSLFLLLFIRTFLRESKKLSSSDAFIALVFLSPVLLLLPTKLNISGFDLATCEGMVGPLIDYVHAVSVVSALLIAYEITRTFRKKHSESENRSAKIITGIAAFVFMVIFSTANIAGETTKEYVVGLIGPIGMNLFLFFLIYVIVKFKTFDINLIGAQALVLGLNIIIASQLFFVQNLTTTTLIILTLLLSLLGGYFLIRSVMQEIKQREELEKLTKKMADANEKLKQLDKLKSEFVSIASHQMRSPLTSIRGYASMLIEQSFGAMPQKAMDPLKRIEESARHMAMAVEDYLNVSRIESGNMKYNNSDFNLRDETEKICDDIRPIAMEKQLVLLFRTDLKSQGIVNADVGKTVQILHNIINNSMKYTPKGSITVYMRDDLVKKRIYVDVIDTGIGISATNIEKLFQKFSRAANANSVNVTGTGLGLFVARQMAVAMGGDITARSEGDGKGSTFTFELPLMM